jgi:hypothetical protein
MGSQANNIYIQLEPHSHRDHATPDKKATNLQDISYKHHPEWLRQINQEGQNGQNFDRENS